MRLVVGLVVGLVVCPNIAKAENLSFEQKKKLYKEALLLGASSKPMTSYVVRGAKLLCVGPKTLCASAYNEDELAGESWFTTF